MPGNLALKETEQKGIQLEYFFLMGLVGMLGQVVLGKEALVELKGCFVK